MRISDWSSDVCSSDLLAIARDIAHARRRRTAAPAIDALRILTARDLQPIGRPREFHPLHGDRRNIFERDATPSEQIARSRQDHQRRHPRLARGVEAGVLRPDRMFDPNLRGLGRSEEHTTELQSLMRISYA